MSYNNQANFPPSLQISDKSFELLSCPHIYKQCHCFSNYIFLLLTFTVYDYASKARWL